MLYFWWCSKLQGLQPLQPLSRQVLLACTKAQPLQSGSVKLHCRPLAGGQRASVVQHADEHCPVLDGGDGGRAGQHLAEKPL